MINENAFVLEVCKFLNPDKEKLNELMKNTLDYPYILGQLLYNRVGGIAYYTLYKCEFLYDLNREFSNSLKSIYQMNYIYAKNFKASLSYISEILKAVEFPYALLKGSHLVELYPMGLRTSNDFDILINQDDISKLSSLLINEGFKQGYIKNEKFVEAARQEILFSRMNRGETVPFIKKQTKGQKFIEIDVNFSLDYKAMQKTEAVSEILNRVEKNIHTKRNELFTLGQTDFLIHLCAHLYKEATTYKMFEMGRDQSLYKFCDLYFFINKFMNESFAGNLINGITELGLRKECYYALYYTDILFEINNKELNLILKNIEPENKDYLKQIYDPVENKTYGYDMDFKDWIFSSDRKNKYMEVNDE